MNRELEELERLMAGLAEVVAPGGVAAIVSFHSLEDRLVKRAFVAEGWTRLSKKPLLPCDEECDQNPRARSAKLRAARRTSEAGGVE